MRSKRADQRLVGSGMKRCFVFLAMVLTTLLCATCSFPFVLEDPPPFKFDTRSPNSIYSVQIERRQHKPTKQESYSWDLILSVSKQGQSLMSNTQVDDGDVSTHLTLPKYPELNWVSENVFRLGEKNALPELQCDMLFVHNSTEKTVQHLIVEGHYSEAFFVIDLQPGASVTLYAQPQTDKGQDRSEMAAHGQLVDGKKFNGYVSFEIRGLYKAPAHYCLTIQDDEVTIRSHEFEGSKQEFSKENLKKLKEVAEQFSKNPDHKEFDKTISEMSANQKKVIIPRATDCGLSKDK